jgi:hypothetical protein
MAGGPIAILWLAALCNEPPPTICGEADSMR